MKHGDRIRTFDNKALAGMITEFVKDAIEQVIGMTFEDEYFDGYRNSILDILEEEDEWDEKKSRERFLSQ